MTTADFISLKDYILGQNTYLDNGFANAFKVVESEKEGQIIALFGSEYQPVMPLDNIGNYFYLRNEGDIRFTPREAERLTDNGAQRLTFLDTLTVQLVAFVRDADVYHLISNLRDTVMRYTEMSVIPTAASYSREAVIIEEMKGLPKEAVQKALQNVDQDMTIVRVTLSVNKRYVPANCEITNPCKDCTS